MSDVCARRWPEGTSSDRAAVMQELGKLEHPPNCPEPSQDVYHRWVLVWDGTDNPRWECIDCHPYAMVIPLLSALTNNFIAGELPEVKHGR